MTFFPSCFFFFFFTVCSWYTFFLFVVADNFLAHTVVLECGGSRCICRLWLCWHVFFWVVSNANSSGQEMSEWLRMCGLSANVVLVAKLWSFEGLAHRTLLCSSVSVNIASLCWPKRYAIILCSCPIRSTRNTVLGPLLFLTYINDLPAAVQHSSARLFADDSLL